MSNSLEAITTRYIDFYQIQDKYGANYTQSYAIYRIDENGILTDEIISMDDLEELIAANSTLAARMETQGITTDGLGNACFTTDKLSRFLKYGLDTNGNLYVYNYTGERQLVADEGLPDSLNDASQISSLVSQYQDKQIELYKIRINYLNQQVDDLTQRQTDIPEELETLKSNYDKAKAELDSKLTDLLHEETARSKLISLLQEHITNCRELLYSSQYGSQEYQDYLDMYQQAICDYNSAVDELSLVQNEIVDLQIQQSTLSSDYEQNKGVLENELAEIPTEITSKENEISALQLKVDSYTSDSTTATSITSDMATQYQADLVEYNTMLTELQQDATSQASTQLSSLQQLISDANQLLKYYDNYTFFSAIDANYSIKWGNIEASNLSIMRLIMLITIARAESVEESLVEQMDGLATNSALLQSSASAMELILNNTVNYNTTFNNQTLGDYLKNELEIASSTSLPTTDWSETEKDAVIKAIEDRQDALNVVSQETSINIQSLINKRDQCYLLGSNSTKLLYSGNLSVARNI